MEIPAYLGIPRKTRDMDKQTAKDQLKRIQEWLEAGEDQVGLGHVATRHGGCCCGGGSGGAVLADHGLGANGSPMVLLFKQLANAFRPALAGDPAEQWQQFASAPILSATALSRLAAGLRTLGADESGARGKFCEGLSSRLDEAATFLRSAGAGCLGGSGSIPITAEGVRAVEQALAQSSALLLDSPEGAGLGSFAVYGEGLAQVGAVLVDFLRGLVDRPADSAIPPELAESYQQCQRVSTGVMGQVALCFFFGIGANVPRPANVCPPSCPKQGCTRYCYDEYSSPTGCGPWVRVNPGVFTSGGWSITCTWTIESVVKDVCCCYPDNWHRFWAYGACTDCTVTTTIVSTRTGTYTYMSYTRTAPSFPPNSFKIQTSC